MDKVKLEEKLDRIENLLLGVKKVLTFDEACDYTGISKNYLYKLTASGAIPHSKPNGKRIFFDIHKLNSWLLQNERVTKEDLNTPVVDQLLDQ